MLLEICINALNRWFRFTIGTSLLVNVSRIKEINKHFNSCFIIKIDDMAQTRLQSGRGYYEQVKKLMEI
jgi:two-component system, LytTR family, response regulator